MSVELTGAGLDRIEKILLGGIAVTIISATSERLTFTLPSTTNGDKLLEMFTAAGKLTPTTFRLIGGTATTSGGGGGGGGGGGPSTPTTPIPVPTPTLFNPLTRAPSFIRANLIAGNLAALQAALPDLTFTEDHSELGFVSVSGADYQTLVNRVSVSEFVTHVEPYLYGTVPPSETANDFQTQMIPTDPLYHHANQVIYGYYAEANNPDSFVPQTPWFHFSYPWKIAYFEQAWDITRGQNSTLIAIVDTGEDSGHPEFSGRRQNGWDYYRNDGDTTDEIPPGVHGFSHGTHVAGIIAAGMNNDTGIVGVCPSCQIVHYRACGEYWDIEKEEMASSCPWAAVSQSIRHATDAGARVINLSLGGEVGGIELEAAIDYALAHGTVVVAATGNNGGEYQYYPAAYSGRGLIAVGSTDMTDTRSNFSNFGPHVSVTAPGSYILNSVIRNSGSWTSLLGTDYDSMTGTSMAAPMVSGLAGLILSEYPHLTAWQVKAVIEQSADDKGPSGFDIQYGHGRIHAQRALQIAATVPLPNRPPVGQIQQAGLAFQGHTLRLTAAVTDPEGDSMGFRWYTSHGTLHNTTGNSVYLSLPSSAADVQIRLEARDSQNNIAVFTRTIPVITHQGQVAGSGGYY